MTCYSALTHTRYRNRRVPGALPGVPGGVERRVLNRVVRWRRAGVPSHITQCTTRAPRRRARGVTSPAVTARRAFGAHPASSRLPPPPSPPLHCALLSSLSARCCHLSPAIRISCVRPMWVSIPGPRRFNNGCDISCDSCDGSTGQVIHPRFNWTGESA